MARDYKGFGNQPMNAVVEIKKTAESSRMEEIKCEQVGQIVGSGYTEMTGRVYSQDGLAPAIRTFSGGNTETKVMVVGNYSQSGHNASSIVDTKGLAPTVMENHGTVTAIVEPNYRFFKQAFETLKENECKEGDTIDAFNKRVNTDGVCPTITTRPDGFKTAILAVVPNYELSQSMKCYINSKDKKYKVSDGNLVINRDIACSKTTREGNTRADASDYISPDLCENANIAGVDLALYRIRKLIPRECFCLMGVKEKDFENVAKNQSTSSLYHLAGDSIVTSCLMGVFGSLLGIDYQQKIDDLVKELRTTKN